MSVVTEHLKQQASVFDVIPHRQVYTSTDEARALGIDAGEVLKPLAMRTGSGYALMVIAASRRLDLRLARGALADNHARLATEDELGHDFAGYQLGRCRRLVRCSAPRSLSIPRCWATTRSRSLLAPRPSRSRCAPRSCSAANGS
jgi:hypothetical protein